jgi:hypothetical protein
MRYSVVLALIAVGFLGHGSWAQAPQGSTDSKKWIVEAANDTERFQRIEKYLRGFDQPMWEVGERYEKIHAALMLGNFELASYHWAKIRRTIENGTMKRPARRMNAEEFLLATAWNSINEDLGSGDRAKTWRGFEAARVSCMSCHVAERVGYMNDQSMFTDLRPPHID